MLSAFALINAGADINFINCGDRSALIMTCACINEEFCKLLLESGVELYKSGAARYAQANYDAIQNGTAEFPPSAEIQRKNIMHIHQAVSNSKALFHAIKLHDSSAIAKLVKPLNITNLTDEHGFTPLYRAIEQHSLPMCRELLKGGANPNVKDANGLAALDLASIHKQPEILELLQIYAKETLKNRCLRAIIEVDEADSAKIFGQRTTEAQLTLLPSFVEVEYQWQDTDTIETVDPFGSWYSNQENSGDIHEPS